MEVRQGVHDLGRVDPWQASLERSLARRGKLPCSIPSRIDQHVARPRTPDDRRRGRRRIDESSRLAHNSLGISTLALLLATAVSAFGGGTRASATASQASAIRHPLRAAFTTVAAHHAPNCGPVARSSGYVNPVAAAVVKRERIDQGVDYAGSGTLAAIGAARLTYVGTSETGWPGAFIEYQLLSGPDAGCFVYYAEGVDPATGLRPGETIRAGQPIARIIRGWPTGVELGWGAGTGTKTYAAMTGKWTATDDADSIPSDAGKSFSALIAGLGGPPGKLEG
jgi:hypothetical protein